MFPNTSLVLKSAAWFEHAASRCLKIDHLQSHTLPLSYADTKAGPEAITHNAFVESYSSQ